jgi:transitional endoplasmic reticulum ATPase
LIDSALLRPGRFDNVIFVPPPDSSERLEILGLYFSGVEMESSIDLGQLALRMESYTGADIQSFCREAKMLMLKSGIEKLVMSIYVGLRRN